MKRVLAITALVIFSGIILVPAATAANHKFPLCHGKNSVPCRPDPQPSHGKDCLQHGKGGVNEDHCGPVVGPSPTPTPTENPKCSVSCSTPSPTPKTAHEKHVTHLSTTPLALTGVGYDEIVLIAALSLAFLIIGLTLRELRRH